MIVSRLRAISGLSAYMKMPTCSWQFSYINSIFFKIVRIVLLITIFNKWLLNNYPIPKMKTSLILIFTIIFLSSCAHDNAMPLKNSCSEGHANECFHLGVAYYNGELVVRDKAKSLELFTKACDYGHADGCDNLAWMYYNGDFTTQDKLKSATLFTKACNNGNADACNHLGSMYYKGEFITQDKAKSVRLFSEACDGKIDAACHSLGASYEYGEGISIDKNKAIKYYSKACDMDYWDGCTSAYRLMH